MNLIFLDAETLGEDFRFDMFDQFGKVVKKYNIKDGEINSTLIDTEIALTNKVPINKSTIDLCPKLKLICVLATGTNHVDVEYAKSKGIVVKNCVGYSTDSVAQHTFNMVLSLLGQNKEYSSLMGNREWSDSNCFTSFSSRPISEIAGKTWGIIGLGNIGKKVAKIAEAFGADVQYFSTTGKNQAQDYKQVSLETLMKSSDIISIHAPLNDNTKNLISKTELNLLKENSVLINVGRGGIIDENDFMESFKTKNYYAGIDVFEREPIDSADPLYQLLSTGRLFLTPHIAWASKEARTNLLNITISNIKDFLV